jgi:UPF0271 protein
MVTIPEVLDEIKDEESKLFLSLIDIKIEEPDDESVKAVREAAIKSGDIYKLSDTDIRLIAKALDLREKGAIIVTDDYAIQNIAALMGIEVDSIMQTGISRTYRWIRVCKGCKRPVEGETCPICGSETYLRKKKI